MPDTITLYDPLIPYEEHIKDHLARLPGTEIDFEITETGHSRVYKMDAVQHIPETKTVNVFNVTRGFGYGVIPASGKAFPVDPEERARITLVWKTILERVPEFRGHLITPFIALPLGGATNSELDILASMYVKAYQIYMPHAFIKVELEPGAVYINHLYDTSRVRKQVAKTVPPPPKKPKTGKKKVSNFRSRTVSVPQRAFDNIDNPNDTVPSGPEYEEADYA